MRPGSRRRKAGAGQGDEAPDRRTRRRLLAGLGAAGASALAGCGGLLGRSGAPADAITLESLAVGGSPGGPVSLRRAGRPALVDFFATWCGVCVPQMERLGRLRERFGPDRLHMVSVTPEGDEAAVRGFWRRNDGSWPVATDPDNTAVRSYSVTGLPTLVVVTADGEVRWRHRGLAGFGTLVEQVRRVG